MCTENNFTQIKYYYPNLPQGYKYHNIADKVLSFVDFFHVVGFIHYCYIQQVLTFMSYFIVELQLKCYSDKILSPMKKPCFCGFYITHTSQCAILYISL